MGYVPDYHVELIDILLKMIFRPVDFRDRYLDHSVALSIPKN